LRLHRCECGRECKSAGGLASHQRTCIDHLDALRIGAHQLELLPPAAGGRGPVEVAAARDLEQLRDQISDGCQALEATYQLLARELDRAEVEGDRYGKINTARQLQAIRRDLAPVRAEIDAATVDDFFAAMSAKIRDTTEP
jgi:hypothetical protein